MTAKELFEALGYEEVAPNHFLKVFNVYPRVLLSFSEGTYKIMWWRNEHIKNGEPYYIDVQLHQAITKRLEELGWNND